MNQSKINQTSKCIRFTLGQKIKQTVGRLRQKNLHRLTGRLLLSLTLILGGAPSLLPASPLTQNKAIPSSPENSREKLVEQFMDKGLRENYAFTLLKKLTALGPRLTASPQAAAAVEFMRQTMVDLGLENVHLEEVEVNRWIRGDQEKCFLISSTLGTHPLAVTALGGSVGTPPQGISAQVLEVHSFVELKNKAAEARGKIVFFNQSMDPTLLDTFRAYGQVARFRSLGASAAARVGAVAALVRSPTTANDDFPHTGMMRYQENVPRIPGLCLSTKSADFLSRALKSDPQLHVYLWTNCRNLPPTTSYNVIGQITGAEKPAEIILLGGHLDSWDLAQGAHDDGAGCVQAVEALRLTKALGLRPMRTIRAVLFMNEEFGGSGGRDYVRHPNRRQEKHLLALESDRGGFRPLYIGLRATPALWDLVKSWEPLFQKMGLIGFKKGGGGVDIAPLGAQGTILAGLIPDCQRYFDVHHSALDTIDSVNPRELELGALAMGLLAYLLAEDWPE